MRHLYAFLIITLTFTLPFTGCNLGDDLKDKFNQRPEVEAVSEALKTVIPLGYAANLAMEAIAGNVAPHVTIVTNVGQFPGQGLIKIDISSAYPLPIGSDTSGTIFVAGLWSSVKQAIFSIFFVDLDITHGTFTLSKISTFPVIRDTTSDSILAVYAYEDVNAGSDTAMVVELSDSAVQAEFLRLNTAPPLDSAVALEQDAWIINVNNKGTVDDPDNDSYFISGARQYVEASPINASVIQLVMIGAGYTPTIPLNPYEGRAVLRDIDVSQGNFPELGTAVLTFHSKNDGKVDVFIATGVYTGRTGSSLALNLDE